MVARKSKKMAPNSKELSVGLAYITATCRGSNRRLATPAGVQEGGAGGVYGGRSSLTHADYGVEFLSGDVASNAITHRIRSDPTSPRLWALWPSPGRDRVMVQVNLLLRMQGVSATGARRVYRQGGAF